MIPAQIQKTVRIPAVSRASSAMSASFVGVTFLDDGAPDDDPPGA